METVFGALSGDPNGEPTPEFNQVAAAGKGDVSRVAAFLSGGPAGVGDTDYPRLSKLWPSEQLGVRGPFGQRAQVIFDRSALFDQRGEPQLGGHRPHDDVVLADLPGWVLYVGDPEVDIGG